MLRTESPPANAAHRWQLHWSHGRAEIHALGAMLGPVHLKLGCGTWLPVMHVAPWHSDPLAADLPGILRQLRGEWPCVPFGRCDRPDDLPAGWSAQGDGRDEWPHGFGSNHVWRCELHEPDRVMLCIDYPAHSPVRRLQREVRAVPGEAALEMRLSVEVRSAVTLPLGLHPTFQLPAVARGVRVVLGRHEGIHTYPSRSAGALSQLLPDQHSPCLTRMLTADGFVDLSALPTMQPGEELLQVRSLQAGAAGQPPLSLHYTEADARVGLWWNTRHFPDLMLWISNRGRLEAPWLGRHVALGAEPVNSVFDLGRVSRPPQHHALADRCGVSLSPGTTWHTDYRIAAWTGGLPQP